MSVDVVVPPLPESVSDATLVTWHKRAGDKVSKDEPLVDLETDKVVLEVPAPEDGVLGDIRHEAGAVVLSGDIIASIDTDTETIRAAEAGHEQEMPDATPASAQQPSEPLRTTADNHPHLSPAVRRLVTENRIDPGSITQRTGKDGRLTKADVMAFLKQPPQPTGAGSGEEKPEELWPSQESRPEQRVPMTRLRARIAERLVQAQQTAAMLTTFNEVNLQAVMELRNRYKDQFEKRHGIKLGFMPFFVKATIEALRQYPVINASIDEDAIIYHGYYDIGIAVSSDRGLLVPVLRDADQQSFAELEKSIRDFGLKARNGKITHEELTGGTFTITNGGIFGSMMSTPILNPPQSGILGMHAIKERPVAENGQVVIRPMMYLAFSYDHRIVDGRDAVQFLVAIKDTLEDPARLLLDL